MRIAGVPYQQVKYLGYQQLYHGWAKTVVPWGELALPRDGLAVAIKRPGESAWRIASVEDRIGKGRAITESAERSD